MPCSTLLPYQNALTDPVMRCPISLYPSTFDRPSPPFPSLATQQAGKAHDKQDLYNGCIFSQLSQNKYCLNQPLLTDQCCQVGCFDLVVLQCWKFMLFAENLRTSHTWTEGADGTEPIPYVRAQPAPPVQPHPPSQPSSSKHARRKPRVKSAGKEQLQQHGTAYRGGKAIAYKSNVL